MGSRDGEHQARDVARGAFQALRAAMRDAEATFAHEAQVAEALMRALGTESSMTELAARFPIAEERTRLTRALDEYETRRRAARVALWRVMLAEGCSIGEVSRIFGLSRQLVSRQLRDARGAVLDVQTGQEPLPGTSR
ncbi:MAG TPA: hypothetical protein VLD86_05625 [Ilumatobacteraceae bacterium]|nr:hypothetical protein [Ilumatobacteraceae bacterium]